MKYFLDTEFIEGFHKSGFGRLRHHIDLISIGIVAEDGRKYYAISKLYKYEDANEWVKKNVIDPLYISTVHGDMRNRCNSENFQHYFGRTHKAIAQEIKEFIIGDNIEIYGYFADYDWVLFCSIFGTMMDLPKGFPMCCMDLKQMMKERGLDSEWKKSNCPDPDGQHNALIDARWNKILYDKIVLNPHPPQIN